MVALSRRRDDWPPADGDEFLAFAGEFSTPTLYNAIKHAKRQGDIKRYGFPQSVRRHFERLGSFSARTASDRRRHLSLQPPSTARE